MTRKTLDIIEEVKLLWGKRKKPEGKLDFRVYITYEDGRLKVEVEPENADIQIVRGILGIVFLELQGIKSEEYLRELKKETERLARRGAAYIY